MVKYRYYEIQFAKADIKKAQDRLIISVHDKYCPQLNKIEKQLDLLNFKITNTENDRYMLEKDKKSLLNRLYKQRHNYCEKYKFLCNERDSIISYCKNMNDFSDTKPIRLVYDSSKVHPWCVERYDGFNYVKVSGWMIKEENAEKVFQQEIEAFNLKRKERELKKTI